MQKIKQITVEVAYATVHKQRIISVVIEDGATIERVIDCSGMVEIFPEIDLLRQKVGVFSQARKLTDRVKDGDRIEIYRELMIDPKEARRGRVGKK
jgi:putative ubiquitin-RnfH superfamily antitoxin RatB of RatAB toxin-antitoxin module